MPRYKYQLLEVSCLDPRRFGPTQLREAVDHLKTVPGSDNPAMHIGISAEALVQAGPYKLRARPILKLHQILGRTPREVWELFDADIDAQRDGLINRCRDHKP